MKNMVAWFRSRFTPLQQLLITGSLLRLLSVLFSRGFGWHDDHFLIIESAQSWVDGYYNYWLPTEAEPNRDPQGHALFYIGLHYYLFLFLKFTGIADPQLKMMIVRLLHAAWSLLIISYGYRIAEQYAGKKTAWYTGLFLAFYWFMPFMSVRNLVEFVCVPPVLIAIYQLSRQQLRTRDYVTAGLWLGLAFSIRFQVVFIAAGIGLALLIMKSPFKYILLTGLSFLFVIILSQGVVDFFIWKKPFAEFMAYVEYNLNNASTYGTDNWHMYFDLIFGLLIPPLSFLIFAGYFYSWKKIPLIFWPVFIYLIFHTYFPNKQERFIMTILPLMIISGTAGMFFLYEQYRHSFNRKLFMASKWFVIGINCLLLPVMSVSYSKRHRVEAMYYLYNQKDCRNFMVEDSNKENDILLPPMFYYGKWHPVCGITQNFTTDSARVYYDELADDFKPNYVVFWQAENIDRRVARMKETFPGLKYEVTIDPSLVDQVLFRLNPLNDNQTAFIYQLE